MSICGGAGNIRPKLVKFQSVPDTVATSIFKDRRQVLIGRYRVAAAVLSGFLKMDNNGWR